MSRFWHGRAILVLALLFPTSVVRAAEPAKEVVLGFETEHNPPRALGHGTIVAGERPGTTLELLRLVGKRLGITFQYRRMPWKRMLYLMEIDELDGIFHASFKEQRLKIGVYPLRGDEPDPERSLFTQSYVFYVLKNAPIDWDGVRLRGITKPVAAIDGYSVIDELKRMGLPVEPGKSGPSDLEKLLEGRVAAVAGLESMTDSHIEQSPAQFAKVVKLSPPIVNKPYYLMFSHRFYRENRGLAEAIWDAIPVVVRTHEYQRIQESYYE